MVEVRLFDIDIEIAIGNTVKVPVFGSKIYLARYELDTRGCQVEQDTIDAIWPKPRHTFLQQHPKSLGSITSLGVRRIANMEDLKE